MSEFVTTACQFLDLIDTIVTNLNKKTLTKTNNSNL